nr:VQ motif-containing protein [Zea mays]
MLMAAATHYLGRSAHSSTTSSSSISPSPPPWHPVLVLPSNQRQQGVVYDLAEDLATPPSPSPSTTPQHLRPASRRRAGKPRRPRPSRKLPTTYISADAASFRRMVHQVTGAGVGADAVHQATEQLLCRPAPPSRAVLSTATLVPTLDTSAFLLDAGAGRGGRPGAACFHGSAAAEAEACGCGGGGGIGGGGEYSCSNGGGGGFPSLESWDDHDLF